VSARVVVVLVVAGVAVAAGLVAGLRPGGGDPAVVVADERGREVASVPLPEAGRFALSYRHSVYRAEVTETFAVADGGFRLVAIASPSEAVLDYYELEAAASPTTAGGSSRPQPHGWRRSPWSPPRSAAVPWSSATTGCPCSPRAGARPTWSSASTGASRARGRGSGRCR
jgi:hypothetical protein